MQTGSNTQYQINISSGNGDGGNLVFYSAQGATDTFALALAEAIKGVTWPGAETNPSITVTKNVVQTTSYQGDLTTTPGTFQ